MFCTTDLVLEVGKSIISNLHRDVGRQKAVSQCQVTVEKRGWREINVLELFVISDEQKEAAADRWKCGWNSADGGSAPATKSLMLESVGNTRAAPGYCSRK